MALKNSIFINIYAANHRLLIESRCYLKSFPAFQVLPYLCSLIKKNNKMKHLFVLLIGFLFLQYCFSQNVGIGTTTPNASAQLDVQSTNKGMLVPRMTTVQRTAIATPAAGLLVYDTDTNGFWFYNGGAWTQLSTSGSSSNQWTTTGTNISNNNSGNVGIGMLATTAKLSIGGALSLYAGSTNAGILEPSGSNLNMNALLGAPLPLPGTPAGNLIMQHTPFASFTAGRIGIGNNIPEQKLHITGNAMMDGTNPFFTLRNGSTGTQKASLQLSGPNFLFGTDAGNDGEVQLKQNGQIKFAVDAFGNIVQNNSSPYFTIQNGGVNKAYFNVNGNDFGIGTYSGNNSGKMHFVSNGISRATIDGLGNMGVGGSFTPAATLHVNGTFRLNNGNEGANKILVSDAGGNASWENRNIYFLATVNNQTFTSASTGVGYEIIQCTADGANPYFSNSIFTAPVSGFYHLDLNVSASYNANNELLEQVETKLVNISTNTIISSTRNSSYSVFEELGYTAAANISANVFLQAGQQVAAYLNGECEGGTPVRIQWDAASLKYTFSGFKVF